MAKEITRQERIARERIEQARARMGNTIEAIAGHLNPDHLKHELKAGVREQVEETKQAVRGATLGKAERMMHDMERTASETGHTLMDAVRENPVPAAMATIGIGWLLAEARKTQSQQSRVQRREVHAFAAAVPPRYSEPAYGAPAAEGVFVAEDVETSEPGMADRARQKAAVAANTAKDKTQEATDRVRQAASDATEQARGSADSARRRASQKGQEAQQTWHETEQRARRAQVQARQTARENPLAAGAALLALGFAAGLMVPETEKEHEMMGPARDRLVDRAKAAAGDNAESAKDAAKSAASGLAEQVKDTAKEAVKQASSNRS